MARTGRPPKPTKLKILEGNPGKRPLPENEPEPTTPLVIPAIIAADEAALAEWNRIVLSMPRGFYADIDAVVLAICASAWVIWSQATAKIRLEGLMADGSTGNRVAHPLLAVQRQQSEIILRCASQLGMGPAARVRLSAPKGKTPDGALPSKGASARAGLLTG